MDSIMFEDARNPKWVSEIHEQIELEVQFVGENEYVSFVASPHDCTTYGPMLYEYAVNGAFGPIAASDRERIIAGDLPAPAGYIVRDGQLVNIAAAEDELQRRFAALQTPEILARAEVDEEYAAERKAKLKALLEVREQPGWPLEIVWPE